MFTQVATRRALTFIEALVIVIVIGIAGAIMVPRFSEAKSDIRASALRTSLKTIRAQMSLYRIQHDNRYPPLEHFAEQMTLATNSRCQTAPPGTPNYPFGPYLQSVPVNPYTGGNTVGSPDSTAADWHYDDLTGQFHPNYALIKSTR